MAPPSTGPRWELIAKILGAGFLGLLASVTGYVVLVALGEPDARRDADAEIRAIVATQAETDVRLTALIEELKVKVAELGSTVHEMHPRTNGTDDR